MNKHKYFLLGISSLLFFGCARMQRVESNVDTTKKDVQHLKSELSKLSQSVDDLNINQGGATSKMRADLTMLIKQLESHLDKLHAEMDESQYRFKQLEQKIDAMSNQRMIVEGGAMSATGDSAAQGDSGMVSQPGSMKVVQGFDIEKLYNQAREDYINGKISLALKGFQTVYERKESHGYRDNALYWMGECYYKQEDWKKALEYYGKCVTEFPKGNKICSAHFKMGMVHDKLGDATSKAAAWKTLKEQCPSSNEAHRAEALSK